MNPSRMTPPRSGGSVVATDPPATRWCAVFGSREGVSEESVRALISQIPEGWGIVVGGCLGPKRGKCGTCSGGGKVGVRVRVSCPPCAGTGIEPQKLTAVDWYAIKAAMERRMPLMIFPADWARLGLSAGPRRNALVQKYSEVGRGISSKPRGKSRGTDGTEDLFRKAGKPCKVKRPEREG